MGLLRDLVFGTPEQRKRKEELKLKEQEAYRQSYARGKLERARKEGYWAGRGGGMGTIGRIRQGATEVQGALGGLADFGGGMFDLGLGESRKTKKHKAKRKATTIRVDGTTITVHPSRKKRRKH